MAKTINYIKKCPKCAGKYILGTIRGESINWLFKKPDTIVACDCDYGVIHPKQVIQRVDRMLPEVIY